MGNYEEEMQDLEESLVYVGNYYLKAHSFGIDMVDEDDVPEEYFQKEILLWQAVVRANKNTVAVYNSPENVDESVLVGIRPDGTVLVAGHGADSLRSRFADWTEIVAVACCKDGYVMGLRADGTVVVAGLNPEDATPPFSTEDWTEVVSIACGKVCAVGLRADGGFVTTGEYGFSTGGLDRCVDRDEDKGRIVDAACGEEYVLALCGSGRVCGMGIYEQLKSFSDILAIASGEQHFVLLASDGTVSAFGENEDGQCDTEDEEEWTSVVAVACGARHTVGLRADGSVVAVGNNTYGQCDVEDWEDIVAVYCGDLCTVGLQEDGTIVVAGAGEELAGEVSESEPLRAVVARPMPGEVDTTS